MNIAIVGGGIAGLSAAYYLSGDHQLTLFEQNQYAGGHTHTIAVEEGTRTLHVDTGFIVFNERTYPHFCRLLEDLEVSSQPTRMSFGVKCTDTGLEYSGTGFSGFYAQRGNLLSWRHHRLFRDILRFNRLATRLRSELDLEMTVAEFFSRYQFSHRFREQFFLPMGSAIWSCPLSRMEQFPIRFIIDFYANHGLLGLRQRPQWRVVKGGSFRYVEALLDQVDVQLRLGDSMRSIQRVEGGVRVNTDGGGEQLFDHVIFACHSDQALKILAEHATEKEQELLSCFPYQRNHAVLHTDTSILPVNRRAWACWNYLVSAERSNQAVVTYDMNELQGIQSDKTYCVSLNAGDRIDADQVIGEYVYHHPIFNTRRDWAQSQHDDLIDHHHVSYCGAYWGNGFHEDGVRSALAVATKLTEVPAA